MEMAHARAGPAVRPGDAGGVLVVAVRRVRPGQRHGFRPLSHAAGRGRVRLLDLGPDLPARRGVRGMAGDGTASRRRPARPDRAGRCRRFRPDRGMDAAVLAGAVLVVPAGDLRRPGLPGLGRPAAVARRARPHLGLVATVAARRLALAGGVPQPGAVGPGLRMDPAGCAAGAEPAAVRGRGRAAAGAQPAHARQLRLRRRRALGPGRRGGRAVALRPARRQRRHLGGRGDRGAAGGADLVAARAGGPPGLAPPPRQPQPQPDASSSPTHSRNAVGRPSTWRRLPTVSANASRVLRVHAPASFAAPAAPSQRSS